MAGLDELKSTLMNSEPDFDSEPTVEAWEASWDNRYHAFLEAYALLTEGKIRYEDLLQFISKYSHAFDTAVIPAVMQSVNSYVSGRSTIDMAQQNGVQLLTLPIHDSEAATYVDLAGWLAHFTDDQFDEESKITNPKMLPDRLNFLIQLELTLRKIHENAGMTISERADLLEDLSDEYLYRALDYEQELPSYAAYFDRINRLPQINKYAHFIALFIMVDNGYMANAGTLYWKLGGEYFEKFSELYGHEAMQNASYFQRAVSETYLSLLKLAYNIPNSAAGLDWLASSERLFVTLSDFMKIKDPEDKLTIDELARVGRSLIEIPGFASVASSVYALLSSLGGYEYSEEKLLMASFLDGIVGPLVWASNSHAEAKTWTTHSLVQPISIQSVTLEELLKLAKFCWHYLKNYADSSSAIDLEQLRAEFRLILVSHKFFSRGMDMLFGFSKDELEIILKTEFTSENGHMEMIATRIFELLQKIKRYTHLEYSPGLDKVIHECALYERYWEPVFEYIRVRVQHHDYLFQEPLITGSAVETAKFSRRLANARLWQNNYQRIAEDIRDISPESHHQAQAVMVALAGMEFTLRKQKRQSHEI